MISTTNEVLDSGKMGARFIELDQIKHLASQEL